jgi:hypothetical protein
MGPENRRTRRSELNIPVELSYSDSQGQPRLERTHTLDVGRNGARIATRCFHPLGATIHLGIPHLGRSAHCRVVWCSAPSTGGIYQVGVQMEVESNVWGIRFDETGANSELGPDLALLVQMLEEKRVLARGEFQARRQGRPMGPQPAESPSKSPRIMLT